MEISEKLTVNGNIYNLRKLLGHGKGGYSYLAERKGVLYTLKQIHHEPCSYYSFGNKILAEKNDYERLKAAGIKIPEMVELDENSERLVKQFIDGPTVVELVKSGTMTEGIYAQVQKMSDEARAAGLNIDYYPTNFLVQDGVLFYVDYECNQFMEEWSFENWGKKFWSRTADFEKAFCGKVEEK